MEKMILQEISRVAETYHGEHMYTLNKNTELPKVNSHFDTRIIVWHIATHLTLHSIDERNGSGEFLRKMTTIRMLSDYMIFLLIEHPDMLPGHTRRHLYMKVLKSLRDIGQEDNSEEDDKDDSEETKIAKRLLTSGRQLRSDSRDVVDKTGMRGFRLALRLLRKEWDTDHLLEQMFRVWVEMLCYAGCHCSRDSHARSLSSGGEFLTVVWMLAGHCADNQRSKLAPAGHPGGDRDSESDEVPDDV